MKHSTRAQVNQPTVLASPAALLLYHTCDLGKTLSHRFVLVQITSACTAVPYGIPGIDYLFIITQEEVRTKKNAGSTTSISPPFKLECRLTFTIRSESASKFNACDARSRHPRSPYTSSPGPVLGSCTAGFQRQRHMASQRKKTNESQHLNETATVLKKRFGKIRRKTSSGSAEPCAR